MVLQQLGAILMLLFSGLSVGVILGVAVDRLTAWKQMSIREYALDFRHSVKHLDPMVPIFIALAAIGAALYASQTGGTAGALAWASLVCQLVIIAASVVLGEPINSRFRRLPAGTPPETAERDRPIWRRFHRVRTVVSIVAFVLAIVSVTVAVP